MSNPDVAWNRAVPATDNRWRRFTAALPMRTALFAVAAVWFLGAVWSFQEQTAFATVKGFAYPMLLPLVIDGFAVAMAGVAWAASLDARPAVAARLATVLAVGASSASNGAWAWLRANHDLTTVLLGVAVPIAANLAFEVLLAELRRQVQRRRGLPPPVAVPYPRLIRLALAPFRTFGEWRTLVLDLTRMEYAIAARPGPAAPAGTERTPTPTHTAIGSASEHPGNGSVHTHTDTHTDTVAGATPAHVTLGSTPAHSEIGPIPTKAGNGSAPSQTENIPSSAHGSGPTRAGNGAAPVRTEVRAAIGHPAERVRSVRVDDNARPPARRRDLEAVPATPPAATPSPKNSGRRATPDPRVEMPAAHLASIEDAGEFTGEMVGPLLKIDVAARTGRRLLGQARELLSERAQAQADADQHDVELSVMGGH